MNIKFTIGNNNCKAEFIADLDDMNIPFYLDKINSMINPYKQKVDNKEVEENKEIEFQPATDKQKAIMDKWHIEYDDNTSVVDAAALIQSSIEKYKISQKK